MDGLPPPPPAIVARAEEHRCPASVSQAAADAALHALSKTLPQTKFIKAWPACAPGLIAVKLANGTVAYTEASGRFLLLGLVMDTATGKALDGQLDGRAD